MSILADALQPYFLRRMSSLEGQGAIKHFADTITESRTAAYDLDFDNSLCQLKIDFREPDFICSALYADASRFASASFLSLSSFSGDVVNKTLVAWSLIKLYYAAFYAGHCILRFIGQTCSFIDTMHVKRIKTLLDLSTNRPSFGIDAGLYHCKVNSGQTGFEMIKARGSVGGAHEAFWKVFGNTISELSEAVLGGYLDPQTARQVFSKFELLRTILKGDNSGSYSWLSYVRNELQYKHEFGVWLPQSLKRSSRDALGRVSVQWKNDPMNIDLDLARDETILRFVSACLFIAALSRVLVGRAAERSQVGHKSFAMIPLNVMAECS